VFSRRQFIRNCITSVATISLAGAFSSLSVAGSLPAANVPVLLYHRIGDTEGPLTVTSEKFGLDLARLQEMGYSTITLETFRRYLTNFDIELPEKPIMISFDDGYLDNYLNAYPILRRYGMTAAFYIITSMVNEEDRLTSVQIREMSANGMSIGSHTVSHRALGDMGNEEAFGELSLSQEYLQGLLQKSVDFVAYPKGSYNGFTGAEASEAGYCGGFSIVPGTCTRNTNPFVLRRIPVFSFDGDIRRTMLKRGSV
jgi:peptidoglycan/xylan/chitin deacetylase (PgdA/CDA1 family)